MEEDYMADTANKVDELFERLEKEDIGTMKGLSRQEENWLLMTLLQMPWHYADKIEKEEDRKFLLGRAEQIKVMAKAQHEEQMQMQQMQQMQAQQQAPQGEGSKIITPSDFMPPV